MGPFLDPRRRRAMSELLDRLCLRCGLLPGYTDIWGEEHRPSDAARRAVLRAQGIEAETDEQIAAALHRLDSRDWTRPLRPVQVDREGQAHRIGVSLPAGEGGPTYRWRLRRESGAEDQGEFVPVSLEEAGRAQLDGQDSCAGWWRWTWRWSRATTAFPSSRPTAPTARGPGRDVLHRRPSGLLCAAGAPGRGARLGRVGPALRDPLGAQLGHRRFRRPGPAAGLLRRGRGGRGDAQSPP